MNNLSEIIKSKNISRRELSKFKNIVMNCQPNNGELITILNQNIYRNVNKESLDKIGKTIDALFNSLDYPTEEWAFEDDKQLNGYQYIKDSIIEYCTTDIKNCNIIVDNVAFIHDKTLNEVDKNMQLYMSSYGDVSKIINVLRMYSDNYQYDISNYNNKKIYIPVYSKIVAKKLAETKNKQK